nr:uncharacterized protein LOC122269999 [Parasteatoda tepidariorum]
MSLTMEYHMQMTLRLHQLMRFHIDELNAMFNANKDLSFMDPDRAHQQVLLSFSQCYHALYLLQQKIKILHDQMERIKGTTQNLHSKFIFHPANHKPSMHSSFASNSFPPLCIFPPGTPESLNSPARCAFSFEPICLSEESLSYRSPSLKIEESSDERYNDQNPLFKENKMIAKV